MGVPSFALTVGGTALANGDGAALLRAQCHLTCRQEAGCLLLEGEMNPNKQQGKAWLDALQLGAACSFSLGYKGQNTQVFSGYLEEITWDSPLSGGSISVEAVFLDVRGRLMQCSQADAGPARKLSQMVSGILGDSAYSSLCSSPTIQPVPEDWDIPVRRGGESDYEALCRAAEFLCYEFYAWASEVYFGHARPEATETLEFDGVGGLRRLRRRRTLSGQCGAVAVSGTDDKGERLSFQQARKADSGYGVKGLSNFLTGQLLFPEPGARTMAQVQYLAQARMERRQRQSDGLTGWSVGLPEVRPGRFIKCSGLGDPADGSYYVHTVRHTLDQNGFETFFETEG